MKRCGLLDISITVGLIGLFACSHQANADTQARQLIERLRSEHIEERNEALVQLKRLGSAAKEELKAVLNDKDAEVASHAKFLLKRIALSSIIGSAIIDSIPDALDRLAGHTHAWTEVFLEVSQYDSDHNPLFPEVTRSDLVPLVAHSLVAASNAEEKLTVLERIEQWLLHGVKLELIACLSDTEHQVRTSAARALGELGEKDAILPLIQSLKDSVDSVRYEAALALGKLGSVESARELLPLLASSSDLVRAAAARTLGELRFQPASSMIQELLEDKSGLVKNWSAGALGKLRAKESLHGIRKLLKSEEYWTRSNALEALAQISPEEATKDATHFLESGNPWDRKAALLVLARLDDKSLQQSILNCLRDTDAGVRIVAAEAACRSGRGEGIPVLLTMATVLTDHHGLISVNAIYQSKTWNLLKGSTVGGVLEGSLKEILDSIGKSTGIKCVWTANDDRARRWMSRALRIDTNRNAMTALGAVEVTLSEVPYEAVFRDDRVEIVSRDDAVKVYSQWWANRR
jgi:HEAT repeat protein